MASSPSIRLGVDIGGTFTDVALEVGEERWSAKILTTPDAPECQAAGGEGSGAGEIRCAKWE